MIEYTSDQINTIKNRAKRLISNTEENTSSYIIEKLIDVIEQLEFKLEEKENA